MSQTLIKKDCGKHYGNTGGKCSKCAIESGYRAKGLLQYDGTPYSALIGDPVNQEKSIQERAIEQAHKFNGR